MSKEMKLSDAMEKGFERVGKNQIRGVLFYSDMEAGACALGCVYLGIDPNNNTSRINNSTHSMVYEIIKEKFPTLREKAIDCLPVSYERDLKSQIISNNDHEKMSIPAIIKGLRKCKL